MGTGVPSSMKHQHTALKLYFETIEYGNVVPFHLEEFPQGETVVVGVNGFEPLTSNLFTGCLHPGTIGALPKISCNNPLAELHPGNLIV